MNATHAYHAGMLLGELRNAGLHAVPNYDEDGNYTDVIEIRVVDEIGHQKTFQVRVLPPQ